MTPVSKQGKRARARTGGEPIDPALVKAIAHPVRHSLLMALNEDVASPSELAGELGEPIGKVAYHVRILLHLGAIELVREERRRGAIEHYYRATMRPFFDDRQWALLPVQTRRGIFDQNLRRISQDVGAAGAAGGFDHPQTHVSRTPLDLDQEAFDDVVELLNGVLERLLEIQAEAAGRQVERGEEVPGSIATEVALLHFQRASGSDDS
jgi:DNA-binding transcriptional ArsR family regulator